MRKSPAATHPVTSDDVIRPLVAEGAFSLRESQAVIEAGKGPLACEGADDAKGVTGVRHPQDDKVRSTFSR